MSIYNHEGWPGRFTTAERKDYDAPLAILRTIPALSHSPAQYLDEAARKLMMLNATR